MLSKIWHLIAVSGLIIFSCTSEAWSRAAVFSDFSFDQAKQQSQKEGKLLLIDFTAEWCPPCKKMEATTWSDAALQAWMKDNAIAIQVDVDKDSKTAARFHVEAMPTFVLFTPQNADKEFARQDGFLEASELIQWLSGAKSGKSAAELEKDLNSGQAAWEHISKAREMQVAGKSAEELDEYLWIWNNIKREDPDQGDLRVSLTPFELKKLCLNYPPAKAKVTELRDAAEKAENRQDWLILNGVLDDNERSLAWFDKAKTDATQHKLIIANTKYLEPILFSKCRWADAASYLYPDPMAKLAEYNKSAQDMKKPRPDTEFAKDFDPLPNMVLLLYGAYIGAGRDTEAKKIADECIRLDNTAAMRDALSKMSKAMQEARTTQSSSSSGKTSQSNSTANKTKSNNSH